MQKLKNWHKRLKYLLQRGIISSNFSYFFDFSIGSRNPNFDSKELKHFLRITYRNLRCSLSKLIAQLIEKISCFVGENKAGAAYTSHTESQIPNSLTQTMSHFAPAAF